MSCPASSRQTAVCEPIKPALHVMRIFIIDGSPLGERLLLYDLEENEKGNDNADEAVEVDDTCDDAKYPSDERDAAEEVCYQMNDGRKNDVDEQGDDKSCQIGGSGAGGEKLFNHDYYSFL